MVVAAGVAGVRSAGAGLGTCLLGLGLSVEDVLLGSAKGGFNFLDGGFDAGDVLSLVGVFQLGNGCFNCGFLVGGNLVAEFVELLFGLEDDGVGLVDGVDALFFPWRRQRRWLRLLPSCA